MMTDRETTTATESAAVLEQLTIDQVAAMCQVSRRTVERWIAAGDLPASKLPGGLVRIARTDAVALLTPVAAVPDSGSGGGVSSSAA